MCYSDFRCDRFLYSTLLSIVSSFYFDPGVCRLCIVLDFHYSFDLFGCQFVCRLILIMQSWTRFVYPYNIYCDLQEEWIILMSFWLLSFLNILPCSCIQINVMFIPLLNCFFLYLSCINCSVCIGLSIVLSVPRESVRTVYYPCGHFCGHLHIQLFKI